MKFFTSVTDVTPTLGVLSIGFGLWLNFLPITFWHLAFIILVSIVLVSWKGLNYTAVRIGAFSITFAIPLFVMHGIMNPTHDVTWRSVAGLPVRGEGIAFAYHVLADLLVLFVAALIAFQYRRGEFVDWLIELGVPAAMFFPAVQGVSLAYLVREKAEAILTAQQARGIRVGGSVYRRIRALPRIIIPLVSGMIRDIEPRTQALVLRGFGSTRMSAKGVRRVSLGDCLLGVGLALPAIVATLGVAF